MEDFQAKTLNLLTACHNLPNYVLSRVLISIPVMVYEIQLNF